MKFENKTHIKTHTNKHIHIIIQILKIIRELQIKLTFICDE